ncbi:uncharacterized protein [Primulina huaijiensis]|uniref:uncharacterized protein n=1 Tax=Primulina huaijiensis TaxID=1492673 RepID=UPI003CC73C6A
MRIIDSIYSLCRNFVWTSKHPPIAWASLCKPIESGGLGLKNLKAWNKALLAKTLWNIHMKKDCLWIKWVNHVYNHSPNVWCWEWKSEQSPLIKQIIAIRDEILHAHGSVQAAVTALAHWFGSMKGLSKAYNFFVGSWNGWPWKPLISKSCILPKHKFVLWLVAHRKLLTRDRLPYLSDKSCALCRLKDESVNHLFFECPTSKTIWSNVRSWLGMRKIMSSPSAVLTAFRGVYRGSSFLNKMRCVALAATVYHIWSIRNRLIFDNEAPNIQGVILKIKVQVFRSVPCAAEVIDFSN